MGRLLKTSVCLLALLLSGCYLKVDIVGQGNVTSDWSDYSCSKKSCTKVTTGYLTTDVLRGIPADGYTFLGFVQFGDPTFDVGYPVAYVQYGVTYSLGPGPSEDPNQSFILHAAHVIALFEPQENIQQVARTFHSICRLDVFGTVKCWGHSAGKPGPAYDGLVRSVVVDASRPYFQDNVCILTDDKVVCWDEIHDVDWTIPDSITAPVAGAMQGNVLCILQGPGAETAVDCINAKGDSVLTVPPLSNPANIRVDSSGKFCVDDGGDAVCWDSVPQAQNGTVDREF